MRIQIKSQGWRMALMGVVLLANAQSADAEPGDWRWQVDMQSAYGSYSGSRLRKALISAGTIVHGDYLERGGFSFGAGLTRLKYRSGTTLKQQSLYASLRYHLYVDALPGTWTLRLDGHAINNNDPSGNTDNVRVVEPRVSFMNYAKTLYVDLGWARSRYRNRLTVRQWTPTIGLGFNQGGDWFQLRGYRIDTSNPARAQGKRRTTAVDVKWTHWFAPGAAWRPEKMVLAGLAGERIYAVDADAALVYNLADVQRGAASAALEWRLSGTFHLLLMAGSERYRDNTIGNNYSNRFAYADLSARW